MDRARAWIAVGLLLNAAAFAGCGDDDPEVDSRSDGGASDSGAAKHRDASPDQDRDKDAATRPPSDERDAAVSGSGRGSAGRSGGPAEPNIPELTEVQCGDSLCEASANAFARPCCADEATSTCGTSILGSRCMPPREDTGCPDLTFPGLMLPACCTARGMCGIDTTAGGGPGCLDLATAAQRARTAGATVVFPAPRACPAGEPSDQDAGTEDAGR
jgi:hypothetical protein